MGQSLSPLETLATPTAPCLSRPSLCRSPLAEPAPSLSESLAPPADRDSESNSPKEEAPVTSTDADTPGLAKDLQAERQPSSLKKGALVNGLLDSWQVDQ